MRAVVITRPGGPAVLQMSDVAAPMPGPKHILVRVHATAINRADLLQRRGQYPAPPGWPSNIPGLEYAGEIDELGQDVTRWRSGDRVMGIVGGGSYAEAVVVHEAEALPVPANLSLEQAATIPEAFLTAYDALHARLQLRAGESVLIHAVGSGVGTAASQLAAQAGAHVLGTARHDWKLERVRALGVAVTINAASEDFVERVRAETSGKGVECIVDLVGGDYLGRNLQSIATLGRIVVVGLVAGASSSLDMRLLLNKRATLIGTVLRARAREEKIALVGSFAEQVIPLLATGTVRPIIDRVMSMNDVAAAHELVESNATFGKVALRWD